MLTRSPRAIAMFKLDSSPPISLSYGLLSAIVHAVPSTAFTHDVWHKFSRELSYDNVRFAFQRLAVQKVVWWRSNARSRR
jgi:hypothetical protein